MAVFYVGDNGPDGMTLGTDATEKVSFYGATPVVQRGAAVQATSLLSASSYVTVGSNLTAIILEMANTLQGLGLWKGAA